jgi:hypothetical protein
MPTSRFDFRRYVEDLRKSGADRKQDYDSFHSTMSGQEKDKLVQRSHRSFPPGVQRRGPVHANSGGPHCGAARARLYR